MDQLLNKDPTELFYTERTVFREDVNTNSNWTFELGNAGGKTTMGEAIASPVLFLLLLYFKLEIKLIHKHMIMQCLTGCQLVMLFVK